jgi:hypothetical protein
MPRFTSTQNGCLWVGVLRGGSDRKHAPWQILESNDFSQFVFAPARLQGSRTAFSTFLPVFEALLVGLQIKDS